MIKMVSELDASRLGVKQINPIDDFLKPTTHFRRLPFGPMVKISPQLMPLWQQKIKRGMDLLFSSIAILVLAPVYVLTALGVKLTSRGPVLYKQIRIGMNGDPFVLVKFRTMYVDAEPNGPQLSSKNDPRITRFGRLLRKVRLDETPQFFSVITGTMTLVGPRPERKYYIDQIVEKAPHYLILLKVKPGVTSWGQIKYGYAENIPQMVDRLEYDMKYLENMSILTDIKVLIHTIFIILQASGR